MDASAHGMEKYEGQIESNVFPEFRERTVESLIFELEQTEKDDNNKESLKQARQILNDLKKCLLILPKRPSIEALDIAGPLPITAKGRHTQDSLMKVSDSLTKVSQLKIKESDLNYKKNINKELQQLESNSYLKKWAES